MLSHFQYSPFCVAYSCDVIHKAGNTLRIAMPPEEDRATAEVTGTNNNNNNNA